MKLWYKLRRWWFRRKVKHMQLRYNLLKKSPFNVEKYQKHPELTLDRDHQYYRLQKEKLKLQYYETLLTPLPKAKVK